jgi:hypothetical protein
MGHPVSSNDVKNSKVKTSMMTKTTALRGNDHNILEDVDVNSLNRALENEGLFAKKRGTHHATATISQDYDAQDNYQFNKVEEMDMYGANSDLMFEFKPEVHALIKQQLLESKEDGDIRVWQ